MVKDSRSSCGWSLLCNGRNYRELFILRNQHFNFYNNLYILSITQVCTTEWQEKEWNKKEVKNGWKRLFRASELEFSFFNLWAKLASSNSCSIKVPKGLHCPCTRQNTFHQLRTQPSSCRVTITVKETQMCNYFMCDIHTNTGNSSGNSEIPDGRGCRIPVPASNRDG